MEFRWYRSDKSNDYILQCRWVDKQTDYVSDWFNIPYVTGEN